MQTPGEGPLTRGPLTSHDNSSPDSSEFRHGTKGKIHSVQKTGTCSISNPGIARSRRDVFFHPGYSANCGVRVVIVSESQTMRCNNLTNEEEGVLQDRLLRRREVEKITGLSRSSIYRLMEISDLPRPVKIGPGAVRWKASDIKAWIESRPVAGSQVG